MGPVLPAGAGIAAVGQALHPFQQLRLIGSLHQLRPGRPGAHGAPKAVLRPGRRHGQHREVGLRVAEALIGRLQRRLFHDYMGQDIIILLLGGELCQRTHTAGIGLHLRIQHEETGQHIGKAIAPPECAAHSGAVPKLNAHDVLHAVPDRPSGIGIQTRVLLQLAQRHHGSDAKLRLRLLDLAKSKGREVNGRVPLPFSHFEPARAAQHAVGPALIQLPRFLQRFRPFELFKFQHMSHSPLSNRMKSVYCTGIIRYSTFPPQTAPPVLLSS